MDGYGWFGGRLGQRVWKQLKVCHDSVNLIECDAFIQTMVRCTLFTNSWVYGVQITVINTTCIINHPRYRQEMTAKNHPFVLIERDEVAKLGTERQP